MKKFAVVSGICASFVLAAAMVAIAQDEHQDQQQNDRQSNTQQDHQDKRQDQAKPADHPNEERQNQTQDRQNTEHPAENGQNPQQPADRQSQKPQDETGRNNNRQSSDRDTGAGARQGQAQPQAQGHGDEHARAGQHEANRRRISDQDFRSHFGREHRFAPGRLEVYEGRPRFSYGGYVFELDQPWPGDWAYDQSDCYVDYVDDEYWLFNDRHPGVRLLLTIVG